VDLGEIRVRVSKEPNGGEERKKEKERKMMGSGLKPFYINKRTGSNPTRSTLSHSQPLV